MLYIVISYKMHNKKFFRIRSDSFALLNDRDLIYVPNRQPTKNRPHFNLGEQRDVFQLSDNSVCNHFRSITSQLFHF